MTFYVVAVDSASIVYTSITDARTAFRKANPEEYDDGLGFTKCHHPHDRPNARILAALMTAVGSGQYGEAHRAGWVIEEAR